MWTICCNQLLWQHQYKQLDANSWWQKRCIDVPSFLSVLGICSMTSATTLVYNWLSAGKCVGYVIIYWLHGYLFICGRCYGVGFQRTFHIVYCTFCGMQNEMFFNCRHILCTKFKLLICVLQYASKTSHGCECGHYARGALLMIVNAHFLSLRVIYSLV